MKKFTNIRIMTPEGSRSLVFNDYKEPLGIISVISVCMFCLSRGTISYGPLDTKVMHCWQMRCNKTCFSLQKQLFSNNWWILIVSRVCMWVIYAPHPRNNYNHLLISYCFSVNWLVLLSFKSRQRDDLVLELTLSF